MNDHKNTVSDAGEEMNEPLKILYVDDEALLKMAFVETLKQQGFYARGALSGQEALDLAAVDTPDIIILDVMMKPMDGWETLSRLKSMDNGRNVPVIMQTGKSLTIKDVLKYGDLIEDYLVKPVRLPELIRAINAVGERRSMIEGETATAREKSPGLDLIDEYAALRRKVLIGERLIEVLGRIYPFRKDGSIETDIEMPELNEVVNRFTTDKARLAEVKEALFGPSPGEPAIQSS